MGKGPKIQPAAKLIMLEFNLERALAGARLITRDGREATGFRPIKRLTSEISIFRFEARVGNAWLVYTRTGSYWLRTTDPLDLFENGGTQ